LQNKIYNCLKICFVLLSNGAFGQTYHHTTLWSRVAIQKEIKNWEFRLEHDFRQQNDFTSSSINPFQKPLMRWLRVTSTYNTGNFSHTLVLPNWIVSYPLVSNSADLQKPKSVEWRYAFLEEYSLHYKKFTSSLRAGFEFRNITTNNIVRNTGRLRIRLSEALKTSEHSNLNLSFEPLYNTGPNKSPNTFSQYQAVAKYTHSFGKLDIITGLNHLLRKRNTLVEYDLENAIVFNLIVNL
jgi:Protein of unknown function (DUF2490)